MKTDVECKEFINTLKVYSYFVQDRSMFYEIIEIVEVLGLSTQQTYVFITKLIKIIGGSTIRIPTIDEILIYKWILSDKVDKRKLSSNLTTKYMRNLIESNYNGILAPEVNITELSKSLVRMFKYGKS